MIKTKINLMIKDSFVPYVRRLTFLESVQIIIYIYHMLLPNLFLSLFSFYKISIIIFITLFFLFCFCMSLLLLHTHKMRCSVLIIKMILFLRASEANARCTQHFLKKCQNCPSTIFFY